MSDKLAILGGTPALAGRIPHYVSVGEPEAEAAANVIRSGCLSDFLASPGEHFYGGPAVRAFEEAWSRQFGANYSISVNSATSGLFAAMGAIGVEPGDEVIVPPYTMSATVMAPLIYGGLPVFADIEENTFCLDPGAVERQITSRTKAILAVNLFGHPAQLHQLKALAEQRGLYLIEDNSQAPLAAEYGRRCGTIGDIGIFSLNYHKHIHTGEGGVCVTAKAELAQRLQLIRNHAENAVDWLGITDLSNLIGFNYRMTEVSCAIGLEQLKRIDWHVERREQLAQQLSAGISDLCGLQIPLTRDGCRHVYYVWALRFNQAVMGVRRDTFVKALAAEGCPMASGYVRPLYMLPVFQQRIAIGRSGFPFTLSERQYERGMCPVVERMYERELLFLVTAVYDLSSQWLDGFIEAFRKVHKQREELRKLDGEASDA
jgi:perosamine synthetase